jgi:acetyltransferase-like isoleucine patch superfamily enzyme
MSLLSDDEVRSVGFASVGRDVQLSSQASFYGANNIRLGNHVRIDDFCVLSSGQGGIDIGNYVHIAVGCSLIGSEKIVLSDFCNLSSRVSIYSSNDDYSGRTLTNPTVPAIYKNVEHAPVHLEKHVIIGSGSVILPGVLLAEGVAIGALSLVKTNCDPYRIYAGSPLRFIKHRGRGVLDLEAALLSDRLRPQRAKE